MNELQTKIKQALDAGWDISISREKGRYYAVCKRGEGDERNLCHNVTVYSGEADVAEPLLKALDEAISDPPPHEEAMRRMWAEGYSRMNKAVLSVVDRRLGECADNLRKVSSRLEDMKGR